MRLLASLAVRTAVILGIGLLADLALRHRAAALRHFVLAATLLSAAAVLPLSGVMADSHLSLTTWDVGAADEPWIPGAVRQRLTLPQAVPAGGSARPALPLAAASLAWIPGVWFTGVVAAAALLLTGLARVRRVAVRATRIRDARWVRMTQAVSDAYGLRRTVALLQTDAPDLLATWGLLRPHVLLPSHAKGWSDDRIHAVLCHELAHIRRRDWAVQMGAEALRALLWFNPLMWITCTRLRRASEQACDDAVLEKGIAARDYAAHLLDLARQCRRSRSPWLSSVPMAHPSTLERRIAAMLNPGLDRRMLSRRSMAMTAAFLLAVTLPAAALHARQSGPATFSGAVYDTSGAVLPGVRVILEDVSEVTSRATTNASGQFAFPQVQPGHYVLTAALPGFRKLRQEFDLGSRTDWDRAITLQLGTVEENITVSEPRAAGTPLPAQPLAQRVRVGGSVRPPHLAYNVRPVYPASMREAGREAVVPIEAIIGQDGTVNSVRVLSAQIHPDFAIAAADAVRQWRFTPTLLNGVPVDVAMTVSVDFKLSDQH